MRAQNLTISLPYAGCDKNCPYCISRMTGYIDTNRALMIRNLRKVKQLATTAQVTSILLTGKGEPTKDFKEMLWWLEEFKDYHTELQTNGILLRDHLEATQNRGMSSRISALALAGLNVLALSTDSLTDLARSASLVAEARKYGMIARATLSCTHTYLTGVTLLELVQIAKQAGFAQLSFRKLTIPSMIADTDEARAAEAWIKKNASGAEFEGFEAALLGRNAPVIRRLPFGATVYDVEGIAVTAFDYCIQESNNDDDIRSLIFMEDGHVYTSWSSRASVLF